MKNETNESILINLIVVRLVAITLLTIVFTGLFIGFLIFNK